MGGLSWPLPIVGDRMSFILAANWVRDDVFLNGYRPGVRVPLALGDSAVRDQRRLSGASLGLAVDLLQWR
jgi:hypothetical protein